MANAQDLWIFGYGSLVWRPDFEHAERVPALARGWVRRFAQGSTDHRGVPGAPGRVVTLLPDPHGICHGAAFRVPAASVEAVVERLDRREVGGYERVELQLELRRGGVARARCRALTYVAHRHNPNYLGEADLSEVARQVLRARGPSGPNVEYVLELDDWLHAHGCPDPHVRELARLLRRALA